MPANQTVPYVGGQINYVSVDNSDREDGVMWGPVLGIKFGVNEKTSFFIEYQYQLYDGGVGDSADHANAVVAGFSFKF